MSDAPLNEETSGRDFRCDFCSVPFETRTELERHLRVYHDELG